MTSPHPAGTSLPEAPITMSATPSPVTFPARPIREPKRARLAGVPWGSGLSKTRSTLLVVPLNAHALPWPSLQPLGSGAPQGAVLGTPFFAPV